MCGIVGVVGRPIRVDAGRVVATRETCAIADPTLAERQRCSPAPASFLVEVPPPP
jgi:hypothetical protein